MMNTIRNMVLTSLLALMSSGAVASVNKTENIETLFPAEQVEKMIDLAFENMSIRYTVFATQFNYCQQHPKHSDCGDSYQKKRTQYQIAKGNHDVLEQVFNQQMKTLVMPEMAYPTLVDSLRELAYLDSSANSDIRYIDTLHAVNEWLDMHEMPQTEHVYFLHALMIRTEALSQQIRDEDLSS
ncbi:hypothetical protein L1D34_17025 [Vibrio mediterranei]|uniref:hypothetical protein n=1 Tax=Vibrio mediterranei TaxID=689 RepID=UPI00031DF5C9|nr:hypothetical protein [Vibrio mediterranei]MCG9626535.1 hypothetical protein [Vibrio mediterranei]